MSEANASRFQREIMVVAIYFAITAVFWFLVPAPAPLTPVGVKVLGVFLAFIVSWP